MSRDLTIGSLFAGIGGLELGLERAGVGHTVWQVERDPFCQRVLAKHWPDAERFDDVCTVGADTLAPVDVICGGFPCQDVSLAGKRAGITEGTRSGLWSEFARLVREMGPRYVVVENVPGLLADGMGRVLGDLAALGYDAEWSVLSAASVGAPHLRERVFVLAYADGERRAEELANAEWSCGGDGAARRAREPGDHGGCLADAAGAGLEVGGRVVGDARTERTTSIGGRAPVSDAYELGAQVPAGGRDAAERIARGAGATRGARDGHPGWAVEPDVGRVAHGVPARVDRLRALGNAVVPQVAEVVGRLIVARERALGAEHVA